MLLLHIIIGLNTGGAEILLERLVSSHKASSAFEHEVLSLTDVGPVGKRLQAQGVKVSALGTRSFLGLPLLLLKLYRHIKQTRPDLIQTWMIHADLFGGIAARLAGHKKIIWSLHAVNVAIAGTRSAKFLLPLGALLSKVVPSRIVCVSKSCEAYHRRKGYDAGRMTVIPNGVDLTQCKTDPAAALALRKEAGIPENALVVGCVARFNGTKDMKTWVKAAGITAKVLEPVYFLLVGPGMQEDNASLKGWVENTGEAPRFCLMGERRDVPVCLAAMDVFCLSSLTESFGLVVAEAMAMGKPCVVTKVDNLPDLVGDCGLVVPPKSPKRLAAAMLKLLQDTAENRFTLGQKARARVEAHFSMPRMMAQYEALYTDLFDTNNFSR